MREAWLEVPLDVDGAPGWIAAYRLVPVDGRPVVAEIRLLPDEPRRKPGQWSAERLGADAEVPAGGVPFAAVRALKPSDHVRANWPRIVRQLRRHGLEAPFDRQGFAEPEHLPPRRPGARGHGDLFYAEWAKRYARACRQSRRPIALIVEQLAAEGRTFERRYVRDVVHDARDRGLLTKPEAGKAGGELTPRARRLLAARAKKSAASRRGGRRADHGSK